jgi:serine/threonine-protein kinase
MWMTAVGWRVSGFTELRELGAGSQGRVVLARHDESGRSVAIKYVHGDPLRLRSEADMLKRVKSPHVVRLYDFVPAPDGAALLLEYVDGCTLSEVLAARGAMPPEAALAVLKGSLLGLAAGHTLGIVHRDYKPDNVLISAMDGQSRLADFGIAVDTGGEGGAGTPSYMAPEQWRHGPATPATDVYAATCVFFECVTGSKPYLAYSTGELAIVDLGRQHIESPIPLERLPEKLRQLVAWGMAKNPGQRPRGAEAFVEELERTAAEVYGPDWETRGLAVLAMGVATMAVPAAVAVSQGGGAVTGTVTTAKTGLLAFASSKAAMIAAGALVVALGTGAVYIGTESGGKPRTVPAAAAFGFANATLDTSYPVQGRPAFKVTGAGIPQVTTGGDKARRDAINEALREPVDKAVADSRTALADSKELGKSGPGCAGASLSVKASTGQLGPGLASVRYEFAAGLLCNTEVDTSYAAVTVDLAKAAAISPQAMFQPGTLPKLAARIQWKGPAAGCPAPKTLDSGADNPVVFTFLKSGLEAARPADGLGCQDQRALVAYSKITDLLQPDLYAKALAGAPAATIAPSVTPSGVSATQGPGGTCDTGEPSLHIRIVSGRITCAEAAKVARQDQTAPSRHGKWTCVRNRQSDGSRSCTNKIVTFVYS